MVDNLDELKNVRIRLEAERKKLPELKAEVEEIRKRYATRAIPIKEKLAGLIKCFADDLEDTRPRPKDITGRELFIIPNNIFYIVWSDGKRINASCLPLQLSSIDDLRFWNICVEIQSMYTDERPVAFTGKDFANALHKALGFFKKEELRIAEDYCVDKGVKPERLCEALNRVEVSRMQLYYFLAEFLPKNPTLAHELDELITIGKELRPVESRIEGTNDRIASYEDKEQTILKDMAAIERDNSRKGRIGIKDEIVGKATAALKGRFNLVVTR